MERPTKSVFNPTKNDFSWNYAEEDTPTTYVLKSMEITTFPEHIARHLAHHLAQKIVLDRGVKTNYEDEYQETLKAILIDI